MCGGQRVDSVEVSELADERPLCSGGDGSLFSAAPVTAHCHALGRGHTLHQPLAAPYYRFIIIARTLWDCVVLWGFPAIIE
jgi:hypothetical protein